MLMRPSRNTPMRFSALMGTPPPHPALRATFPASGEVTYLILHPCLVGIPPRHPSLRATFPACGDLTYLILHRALSTCGIAVPAVLGACRLDLRRRSFLRVSVSRSD